MAWSDHRIHDSGDFRSAIRQGGRAGAQHLIVHVAVIEGSPPGPRIGFIVSRKVGNSVIRHRLIRRLRELFRAHLGEIPEGATIIVRALPGAGTLSFDAVRDEFLQALQRATLSWNRKCLRDEAGS